MKKIIILVIFLLIITILYGCDNSKQIIPINNFDMIRVEIVSLDEEKYFYKKSSSSYESRIDYNVFNVRVVEKYNDLVGVESKRKCQISDIIKMAVPAKSTDNIFNYDEFIICTNYTGNLYKSKDGQRYNYIYVDILLTSYGDTDIISNDVIPIINNRIDINSKKFIFNYYNKYDIFIKDDNKKFVDGLTIEDFEEWYKQVYNKQLSLQKKRKSCFFK